MFYRLLLRPILFRLPAETAHKLALHSLSLALAPQVMRHAVAHHLHRTPFGQLRRFDLLFSNPVGLAAGFDKYGKALPALAALGFGFIEAGTVTFQRQRGTKRPRLFRLPEDRALINRLGFNNPGAAKFARRVASRRPDCVLGVSIGKSKSVPIEEAAKDFLPSFEAVFPIADYVAVNVSSPNTEGLRELQAADQLEVLLGALQKKNRELSEQTKRPGPVPMLVKLAPELKQQDLEMIVDVVRRTEISGIIATNTTTDRGGLRTAIESLEAFGEGGLSGAPLRRRSTQIVANLYNLTKGSIPIVGVGGIFTAEDAWEKICAGASLVQLYTGFVYQGPSVARKINRGLEEIFDRSGFRSLDDVVGSRAEELARG